MRGEINALVWRWEAAAAAYRRASELSPGDDRVWRQLALSLGSLDQRGASLEAAQRGLRLNAQDGDLLRIQSLALQALAPESEGARVARETWLRYRSDDGAPGVKARCADRAPVCQQERVPIFVHAMRAAGGSGAP